MIEMYRRYRLRKEVQEARRHLRLVWNMRRDVLAPEALGKLEAVIVTLAEARRGGDVAAMEAALALAHECHQRVNPPRRFARVREWVDILAVAFGVAMAFRAYCFQPFKIPTSSMQPTLYGRHSVTVAEDFKPSWLDENPFKWLKWLATGEMYKEIVAEDGGSVMVYQDRENAPGDVIVQVFGKRHRIPQDAYERNDIMVAHRENAGMADMGGRQVRVIASGMARRDERIWAGFVRSGDQVFVNRIKWYLFPPKRGETIVFATDGIEHLDPGTFYIKRLVGVPGETIGIDAPYLTVNGEQVTEPDTILRVAQKRLAWPEEPTYLGFECPPLTAVLGRSRVRPPHYPGYRYVGEEMFGSLQTLRLVRATLGVPGDTVTLGENDFLAMGDNTPSSYDSRYWGTVPRNRLVGPASVIWWPPSPRWGRVQ